MSETTPAPQGTGVPVQPLVVNIQYVKDLSFEVPGAPQIYNQIKAHDSGLQRLIRASPGRLA